MCSDSQGYYSGQHNDDEYVVVEITEDNLISELDNLIPRPDYG